VKQRLPCVLWQTETLLIRIFPGIQTPRTERSFYRCMRFASDITATLIRFLKFIGFVRSLFYCPAIYNYAPVDFANYRGTNLY
jgi:hypothetical protein